MDTLDERQLQVHITILGWVLIVGQAVILLIAAFIFILLIGIGFAVQDQEATPILTTVAILVSGFLAVLAIPGLVAGIGLLARKPWARILALVVAVLGILNFPVGTIIAIYAFWVLFQQDINQVFDRTPPRVIETGRSPD